MPEITKRNFFRARSVFVKLPAVHISGRGNPFDVRRHAHAEPRAWHPEDGKRVTGLERQRARLDGLVHHPLVWCRRAERGRVFYDALGHFTQTWSNPLQIAMATGGIAWATGLASAPSCG